MTLTYWNIGKRINSEALDNQRAEYGKQIVVSVARQLTIQYGRSFEEKSLRRMMQFAQIFNDEQRGCLKRAVSLFFLIMQRFWEIRTQMLKIQFHFL